MRVASVQEMATYGRQTLDRTVSQTSQILVQNDPDSMAQIPQSASLSPKIRSPNWGGPRSNQTGRPKLYHSDEERRVAAAARRRAGRENPGGLPTVSAVLQKQSPGKTSWGGARAGAGRPLIYKTQEERNARNMELKRQRSIRRWANPEYVRRYEETRAKRQEFTARRAAGVQERPLSDQSEIDEWQRLKALFQDRERSAS